MSVAVATVGAWFGFGAEDWPVPESGTAVCKVCAQTFHTETDGFQIGTDLAGKFWFVGTCENCTPERRQGELHDSLESILDAIHEQERWWKVEDRIDLACGLNPFAPTVHRCSPPAATNNDQEWECPDCERHWASGLFQTQWKRGK